MTDNEIQMAAMEYAKKNRKAIADSLTDKTKYKPEEYPLSFFMAGSPGAGKTEFSRRFIEMLEANNENRVVRMDGDEIRPLLPGYTGSNSKLFHGAVSLIVEKMHDRVLRSKQTFFLDGTFSKFEKATHNIERSLKKGRPVLCFTYIKSLKLLGNLRKRVNELKAETYLGKNSLTNLSVPGKRLTKFTKNLETKSPYSL